ncbi:MAG: membrane protein insertase YidC [Spirochaetia bacterium]|nr:membrane protein insertase YidC [Spirochaetia bacterium]MCF7952653.1 membrane protein insertase YidC [Spirochaetales bacterium]
MERNTLIAVILSAIVITVGFTIQSMFFAPDPALMQQAEEGQTAAAEQTAESSFSSDSEVSENGESSSSSTSVSSSIQTDDIYRISAIGEDPVSQTVTIENGVFRAEFSNQGAYLSSLKLLDHKDDNEPVEAIYKTSEEQGAFYLYFGDQYQNPVNSSFHVRRVDDMTIEFYRDFTVMQPDGSEAPSHFTLTKTFTFKPNDYLFELKVNIENSVKEYPPLDFSGTAYTIGFEPQVGPAFEDLDNRYEYRRFYTYANGKKDKIKVKDGVYNTSEFMVWSSLAGKYFTVIGIPDATRYELTLDERNAEGLPQASRMFFSRPVIKSAENTDVFRFYIGPQLKRVLSQYNDAETNGWGVKDLHLEEAMDSSSWFSWLENVLKFMLNFFYKIVPNYGVAIILLTILIKVVLYPITRKSYQSTAKMSALNPKMQEIRTKYKDNTTKMNQAMAELYKEEGVNPLGAGCLPMLLQFPIFIALYGLLNKHFELRGATFIPGWITDLSSPDILWSFAPVQIPLLGWDAIHLLPFIYLGTMVLSFKMTQSSTGGAASQPNMKIMTIGMPIFLFFVLYNAPSGLLLYWTVMNVVTFGQQKYINKHRAEHEAKEEEKAKQKQKNLKLVKGKASTAKKGGKKKK